MFTSPRERQSNFQRYVRQPLVWFDDEVEEDGYEMASVTSDEDVVPFEEPEENRRVVSHNNLGDNGRITRGALPVKLFDDGPISEVPFRRAQILSDNAFMNWIQNMRGK